MAVTREDLEKAAIDAYKEVGADDPGSDAEARRVAAVVARLVPMLIEVADSSHGVMGYFVTTRQLSEASASEGKQNLLDALAAIP